MSTGQRKAIALDAAVPLPLVHSEILQFLEPLERVGQL